MQCSPLKLFPNLNLMFEDTFLCALLNKVCLEVLSKYHTNRYVRHLELCLNFISNIAQMLRSRICEWFYYFRKRKNMSYGFRL